MLEDLEPEKMTNKELYEKVCNEACHCDVMVGWICHFCRELKSALREALVRKSKALKCAKKNCNFKAVRPENYCKAHKFRKQKRLDPPCDARAYAEYFRSGGSDF